MKLLVEYVMYIFQGKVTMATEGMMRTSGAKLFWYYLTV